MRKQLLAGVATAALLGIWGGAAAAQQPPLMNWSGFYAGAHVGWGQARFSGTWTDLSLTSVYPWRTKPSGILGGGHVGHNWQMDTFVYGWEADVSGMSWKETVYGFHNTSDGITTKLSLLASLRARLGVTLNPSMLGYLTGGLAYARAKVHAFQPSSGNSGSASLSSFGGVVGAGFEWKPDQDWSWRVESLWYIFNKNKQIVVDPDPNTGQIVDAKFKDVIVIRAALSRHF